MSSRNPLPPDDNFQLIAFRMAASRAARWRNGRPRLTPSSVRHPTNYSSAVEDQQEEQQQQQQDKDSTVDSYRDESVETVVPAIPTRRGYHVEIGFALIIASDLPLVMGRAFCLRLHGFRAPMVYKLFYQATTPPPGNIESGYEIEIEETAKGEGVTWRKGLMEFWVKPVEVGTWYFGLEVQDHHLSLDRTWWMCIDRPVEVVEADDEL